MNAATMAPISQIPPHPPRAVGAVTITEAALDLRRQCRIHASARTLWAFQPGIKAHAGDLQRCEQPVFYSTLKTERTSRKNYQTRDEARADVFDYVERFYNPRRRHSTLGYLSPIDYEKVAHSG